MGPAVSVIIPVKQAGPLLAGCLAHLAAQTFRDFDVYVVPDDATPLEGVRVIASGPALPNRKRQIAAGATTAPILAFLDDDAYPVADWLATAVRHFEDGTIVAVGGPAITPPTASARERASGAIFTSPLVTASTRERYVAGHRHDVDALPSCNLLFRRDVFLRDVEATVAEWPGEDILSCFFATRDGGRIVYDPAVRVFHHRRPLFVAHLRQVWRYAFFRGRFVRRYGASRRNATYAVPAAFVLLHAMLGACGARPRTRPVAVAAAAAYGVLVAVAATRGARAADASAPLVAIGIYLTHVTYGVGSLLGFLRGERERDG